MFISLYDHFHLLTFSSLFFLSLSPDFIDFIFWFVLVLSCRECFALWCLLWLSFWSHFLSLFLIVQVFAFIFCCCRFAVSIFLILRLFPMSYWEGLVSVIVSFRLIFILTAPHTFAPQRQDIPREPPSPPVFLLISAHFTATPGIPFSPECL